MAVTNLVFITKKPNQSFEDFVHYFEDEHMPLVNKLLGDTVPGVFRRHYMDSTQPPLIGPPRGIDLVLEMTWEDERALGRFVAKMGEGDTAKLLQDSWTNYCDEKGETVVSLAKSIA